MPNLVIETAFSQSDGQLRRTVQIWLEGSRGSVQVVVVIKMREDSVGLGQEHLPDADEEEDRHSSDEDSAASVVSGVSSTYLDAEDDSLVGPLHVSIELWRLGAGGAYCDLTVVRLSLSLCSRQRDLTGFVIRYVHLAPSCSHGY